MAKDMHKLFALVRKGQFDVNGINPLCTSRFQRFSKIQQNWQRTTPLSSKIVKITNYGIKYTSCRLNIFQKNKLDGKKFRNFDEI